MYLSMGMHRCELALPTVPRTCVEVIGQFAGVSSLLPSCGFWELKSGHQTWQQVLLPTESSCQLDRRDFWADGNSDIVMGLCCARSKGLSCHWVIQDLQFSGVREQNVVGWRFVGVLGQL